MRSVSVVENQFVSLPVCLHILTCDWQDLKFSLKFEELVLYPSMVLFLKHQFQLDRI